MTSIWPVVSFYQGVVHNQTALFDVVRTDDYCYVVLQDSCFHPRDFRWPDQPADKGSIRLRSKGKTFTIPVLDVVKMLRTPRASDLFDTQIIYTKKDMPDNAKLLVALKVDRVFFSLLGVLKPQNPAVICQIDVTYRMAISTGHSLGHLASFALNQVMADYWRKEVTLDSRGYADFIALTQVSSRVIEFGAIDVYRLGKSCRKLGFNVQDVLHQLPQIQHKVQQLLHEWLKSRPQIQVSAAGQALDDSRSWHCTLGKETFSMFCGGTHIRDFREVDLLQVRLIHDEATQELTMTIDQIFD